MNMAYWVSDDLGHTMIYKSFDQHFRMWLSVLQDLGYLGITGVVKS